MKKALLSFTIATLVMLSSLTIPHMVFAQNLAAPKEAVGNINSDPRNDIFADTAVINPGDIWDMSPLWVLPLFLLPIAYWFLYKKEDKKEVNQFELKPNSRYQVSYHDIRNEHPEANEQLEDIESWYSKKETDKPISNSPKLVP